MWDLIVSVPDHCLSFYSEGAKKALEKAGTQALEAGIKILADEAGKYAGEKTISKESTYPETPWRHYNYFKIQLLRKSKIFGVSYNNKSIFSRLPLIFP